MAPLPSAEPEKPVSSHTTGASSTAAAPDDRSGADPIQAIRDPFLPAGSSANAPDTDPATDDLTSDDPSVDLQPMWVDTVLSAGYLETLPPDDALFRDVLATDSTEPVPAGAAPASPEDLLPEGSAHSGEGTGPNGTAVPSESSSAPAAEPLAPETDQNTPQAPPVQPPAHSPDSVPPALDLLPPSSATAVPGSEDNAGTIPPDDLALTPTPSSGETGNESPASTLALTPSAVQTIGSLASAASSNSTPANPVQSPATAASSATTSGPASSTPPLPILPGAPGFLPPNPSATLLTATTPPASATAPPITFAGTPGTSGPAAQFSTQNNNYQLALTTDTATLQLMPPSSLGSSVAPSTLQMQFVGATPVQIVGLQPLPSSLPSSTDLNPIQLHEVTPNYGEVEYQDLYPGINLDFYSNSQGQLEYDWTVAPGADPNSIRLAFTGASQVQIDSQGNLDLSTPSGVVVEHAPVLYQDINGVRQAITGNYVLLANQQVGIQVGAYDLSQSLVIDPVLTTLTASGTNFNATVGQPFSGQVAAFTDSTPDTTSDDYQATIDWGDGQSSAGTISSDGQGGFLVTGTHTYAVQGEQTATVTIRSVSDSDNSVSTTSTASVADAPLAAIGAASVGGVEGSPLQYGLVATFQDPGEASPCP